MLAQGLIERVEERRVHALSDIDGRRQADLGQFFTPLRAASLIAAMPVLPESGTLRILDPGAGVGSLTAAVVARVINEAPHLELEVVAVEVDPHMAVYLDATLDDCCVSAAENGVKLKAVSLKADFIDLLTGHLEPNNVVAQSSFDLVVMNPPYRKLSAKSAQRRALEDVGVECPNIYAAFLALGVIALKASGQLVAITPRSFANGTYFTQFRGFFLDRLILNRIHAFESRSTVFSDTGVLQENIVLAGTRAGAKRDVTLSLSVGHTDISTERSVSYNEVVQEGDANRFIRIPSLVDDTSAASLVESLPSSLADLKVTASTGKVVDFRARSYLKQSLTSDSVPLVYPGNLRSGLVVWPREIRKPQAFSVIDDFSRKQVLPPGCYVLIKRFSSKEEKRRVVAAVWDSTSSGDYFVAVENHLNVLHWKGGGLDRELAAGLNLWLNSSLVDRYFRTFSGHTQVNAGDLRSMRFPDVGKMRDIGRGQSFELPDQSTIDALINLHLGISEKVQ